MNNPTVSGISVEGPAIQGGLMAEPNRELCSLLNRRQKLLKFLQNARHNIEDETNSSRLLSISEKDAFSLVPDDSSLPSRHFIYSEVLANKLDELRDVEEAIKQIEKGKGRKCVDCGRKIPPKRLMAKLSAIRCVSCQSDLEDARKSGKPKSLYLDNDSQ